jgi:N-terminal domain on NACHT_NTPase and P-loop NTPases
MLDPITALGVAGNVVQFIDFGLKATSKAREIHRDSKGKTVADADLEVVTKDLVALNAQLYSSVGSSGQTEALEELCERCAKTAGELLSALQSFTVTGKKTKWKSTRKALKSLWGREAVEEMKKRLLDFREELKLHFLVRLKYA